MRDTTRRGKDPKHSQEMLQVLLDLTRFSRQATASEALETKALELLHYLLARCQASRGAIVLLDPLQQVKISFRPLALEHIQEAEIRALLTPEGAFPAQLSQVPGETHWLLLRLPLFQADLTMAFTPICQSAEISTPLPGSAFLVLGWTTKRSQKDQPILARRSALIAQIGDALSAVLMHMVLADYLTQHQMLVRAPESLTLVSPPR
jgi:GAF domain-containing protein